MSVMFMLACDGGDETCDEEYGPGGATVADLRRIAKTQGWTRSRRDSDGYILDYCPEHS